MSKSKVEIPSFELTSTDFEPRDLVLEVDKDIPTDDISISSQTGNKTEGDYPQELKCSRCDITVPAVQSKERLKRHEEISRGVQSIQTCNECSFTSCTSSGFKSKSHKCSKSADGAKKIKTCNKCDKQFSDMKNFEIHMATKDELTYCDLCDFKSCTKLGMTTHMRKNHGPKLERNLNGFKCPKCDQKFHSRRNLRSHEKAKQDVQKCEDCGFKSCTYFGLLNHQKKVHGKKPEQSNLSAKFYNCTECDYKTQNKPILDIHMKSKNEPTICEHCDFKSCTKRGVSLHMNKVHGIKHHRKKVKTESMQLNGFKCPKCDQKFHSRVNLMYHEKCKQEVQICEDCGFKSCTYLGFLSHLRKTHGKKLEKSNIKDDHNSNGIFDCIKCDQKFYSRANLESHVKKIRDEVLSCSKCAFKSCTKTGLLIHFRNVHDISSDALENVPNGAMILDVLEQKQSIPMTTHGRFMVS